MALHLWFDLLALVAALWAARWFRDRYGLAMPAGIADPAQHHLYLAGLLVGLAAGGLLLGTWNLHLAGGDGIAKSVLGGIAGAILAAESFKHWHGIRRSTGLYFVPGLAVLIVVGRIGCFFGGLDDFTYGTPTTLPWGVDFGDGVARHPVQLYESAAMLLFLVWLLVDYPLRPAAWRRAGFYWFVLAYAGQRLWWEFLKPYPEVLFGLNLFQWTCIGLIAYAWAMLYRTTTHDE